MRDETRGRVWQDFAAWCRRMRLRALPAHPWTVAAFLRWRAAQPRAADPDAVLRVIARVHLARGLAPPDRAPLVRRTAEHLDNLPPAGRPPRSLFPVRGLLAPVKGDPPRRGPAGPGRLRRTTPPLRRRGDG